MNNLIIEQELKKIVKDLGITLAEIPEHTRYWLIRTYSGKYYETFHSNNFVGIGWRWEKDLCATQKIQPADEDYLLAVKRYKRNSYYSRVIHSFMHEVQIGDIVICPAYASSRVLFGKITSEVTFPKNEFPYARIRTVEWIKEIGWEEIPRNIFRFLSTQHGMCSADNLSENINRIMYPFYLTGDKAYLTLTVQKQESISIDTINKLLTFLAENIADGNSNIFLKTELCSPGFLQFLGTPKGIVVFAILLHFIVGGKIEINPKTLAISNETKGIIATFMEKIDKKKLSESINELQIDLTPFATQSEDISSPDMEMRLYNNTQGQKIQ